MGIERAYIRNVLDRYTWEEPASSGQHPRSDLAEEHVVWSGGIMSSQQVENVLCADTTSFRKTAIHFLFKHKEGLKKIPVLGAFLVRQKKKMLQSTLEGRARQHIIDLSDCVHWYRDDFIVECYRRLLGREPDPQGFAAYSELSRRGADNCVIAYAVIRSQEFGGRATVKDVKKYRAVYRKFMFRSRLKHIPILGRVISLCAVPNQIVRLYERIERCEAVMQAETRRVAQMAGVLQETMREIAACVQPMHQIQGQVAKVWQTMPKVQQNLELTADLQKQVQQLQESVTVFQKENGRMARDYFAEQDVKMQKLCEDVEAQASAAAELCRRLDQQSAEAGILSEKLDGQAALSMVLSEKLDGQAALGSGILEKLDGQAALGRELSEKLDGQAALSTVLSEKLDGQAALGRELSEKLDGQAALGRELSEKLDGQAALSTVLSEKLDGQSKLATIISEKIDQIPSFVAAINTSSHTAVTSVAGGVIAISVDGFIMGVPAEEWGFAMFLSHAGYFEHGSELFFESLLKPNMRVIDLGANLGIYTLRALRKKCMVFAYEPTPRTFDLLRQNIKASGFAESGRIQAYQMAVSDQCGTINFYENPSMCGHNSIYGESGQQPIEVSVTTLDSQLDTLQRIDLVKMDIEGAEYHALLGMRELIRRNPDLQIIMEFAPEHIRRAGREPEALLALIHELGFTVYLINEVSAQAEPVKDEELLQAYSVNIYLKREG